MPVISGTVTAVFAKGLLPNVLFKARAMTQATVADGVALGKDFLADLSLEGDACRHNVFFGFYGTFLFWGSCSKATFFHLRRSGGDR